MKLFLKPYINNWYLDATMKTLRQRAKLYKEHYGVTFVKAFCQVSTMYNTMKNYTFQYKGRFIYKYI